MSVAKELRLDEYRSRRSKRLRLAGALHSLEPLRQAVFGHLVRIAGLTGADRVATLWVDEYRSELVHSHVVLDQLSDRPRRSFSAEPLHSAWELGVPGTYDLPAGGATVPTVLAIALGSDGTRAWFVVAESVRSRPLLDAAVRQQIMFLAGECSAVVLHRDLDAAAGSAADAADSFFAGWPILEDLEGREEDADASVRIAQRFVVGRLVRILADEDLTIAPERLADQVGRARAELEEAGVPPGDEPELWTRVLDALERERHEALCAVLVELGEAVEVQGHAHGALEFYRCAHDIAVATAVARVAARAASLSGRVLRRRAEWEQARHWYDGAREIAEAAGLHDVAARAMVGLAVIKKELGNLPAARDGLAAALHVAQASGDADTVARVHHGLLGVEQALGNVSKGLEHGWMAVATCRTDATRIGVTASLGAALMECGDWDAAEDAWTLVAHSSKDRYYLVYAHDALGRLCALKGDRDGFIRHTSRCDALGWEAAGSGSAMAEISYFRGLSFQALGDRAEARSWITRALEFAAEHKYNQILFKAEEALRALSQASRGTPEPTHAPATPLELREGLRALRRELVGSAG